MLRIDVLKAVFQRNFQSYFSGALGYLVIVVFVVAGAFLAFNPLFFTNNLANLDQLSNQFPLLLLFLIPAITMASWSEEKKLGTEELLFTLPASDVEVLLGKYLANLAVYTTALLFSLTHVFVLTYIGEPDISLTMATFFGYWLAGAALIGIGMFASVLTNNATIAFVLGTALCSIPVFIGKIATNSDLIKGLSLPEQLSDFTIGIITWSGVLYFSSLALFFLYLNYVWITRRHWSDSQQTNMGLQFLARVFALGVILIGANSILGRAAIQVDATSEKIYSLSQTTLDILNKVEEGHPVTIQAFISKEVPSDYADVKTKLTGLLKQFDKRGGSLIDVRIAEVEVYSDEADEARIYGIQPTNTIIERDGRREEARIYMGVVFTSNYDEVIIPVVGPGSPIEYELTRSLQTVSNGERLRLAVLETDANVMAGNSGWRIVEELKHQYLVETVSADSEIDAEKFDVLLAVLPSSLTEPQMVNLVKYVESGKPTIIFDDPLPLAFSNQFGFTNAPRQQKPSPGGGMGGMFGQRQPPPTPKADGGKATSLMDALGVSWQYDQIVWDDFNPHPEFMGVINREFLFISPKNGVSNAINPDDEITSGLQELMTAFSGTIRPKSSSKYEFTPLLRTGQDSGLMDWEDFTTQSFDFSRMAQTEQINPNRTYKLDPDSHTIAYHIKGDKRNIVFVADLDMISDWFFEERQRGQLGFTLDNVTFVLNAIDVLAGEDSFLDLRKRRAKLRTLSKVEKLTSAFTKKLTEVQAQATKEADEELETRRENLKKEVDKITQDNSLSANEKRQKLDFAQAREQRELAVAEANIEKEKQAKIEEARAKSQQNIRATENKIRYWATFLSPLPALLLGIIVISLRVSNERRNIAPDRRMK